MKVLTVDDEPDILNLLGYNLKKAGYEVIEATDGREAIELAKERLPDLILLDIMLPNMEGTEALKHLKREPVTADIPVIMLTAKGEEIDRVLGFELGAEDYITKPFSPRELILRVKAVLKRTGESNLQGDKKSKEIFIYNELSLDTLRHKVKVSGKSVELTTTEFDLLRVLMAAPGRVFERDSLLNKAWGDDSFVTERTVDTHVRRLRVKLQGAGEYIETVRGVGYRFAESEEESH
ncbi:MAG: response regulator [Deltaproteobacteria bacterium]|nr:response regulator [Deltaproteobacteria bacterium]